MGRATKKPLGGGWREGRRRLMVIPAMLLGFLAVVGWRGKRSAEALVHPTRHRVSPADAARARAAIPGLEDLTLRTEDGLHLRAWFSAGTRRAVVILVHGLWGNRMQLEPEAQVLARHGYGVLLYDSRASGDSEGDLASWGDHEQQDTRAAVEYVLTRPEIDPRRVAMLGFSVGGSTVAMSAANDPRVRAVILHATWASLEREMKTNDGKYGVLSWWPLMATMRAAGIDFDHVTPIDHVRLIAPRPLLMIAGGADEDTPAPIMQEVYAAAREPKELWVVPGANHGGCLAAAPEEYELRVVRFLDHAFSE